MPSRPARTTTHRPHPVTRSEFARRARRAAASITEACRVGGPLEAAGSPGGRIDCAHPAAVSWAAKRGIDPVSLLDPVTPALALVAADTNSSAARTSRRGRGRPEAGAEPATASASDYAQPQDATDLLQLTLRELTSRHGSAQGFSDWLDTRRQIAETARLESRNDRDAVRLVSVELVKRHVFGMLDEQNRRLLTNAPCTISVRALSAARSGAPLEDLQVLIASAIGGELRVSKAKFRRAIRACKTGDNPPEVSPPASEARTFEEIRAFAHELTDRLRLQLVPTVVDFLLKEIARAACGETWNSAMATEVITTKAALAPEAVRVIGNMLEAHIKNAVTEAITKEPA